MHHSNGPLPTIPTASPSPNPVHVTPQASITTATGKQTSASSNTKALSSARGEVMEVMEGDSNGLSNNGVRTMDGIRTAELHLDLLRLVP